MAEVLMAVWEDNHITEGLENEEKLEYTFEMPMKYRLMPYLWVRKHDPDVVHIQYLQSIITYEKKWWTQLLLSISMFLSLLLLSISQYRIVWTAHHLSPHEADFPIADRAVRYTLIRVADSVIVLDEAMKEVLAPIAPSGFEPEVLPLGNYRELHSDGTDVAPRDNDQFTVGVVGMLRKYKRVPLAIEGYEQSSANRLIIAGNPKTNVVRKEIEKSIEQATKTIDTRFEFIPDGELSNIVDSLDVCLVLNDQQSVPASMHLAAAHRVPVVTTTGGVSEALCKRYNLGAIVDPHPNAVAKGINDVLSGNHQPRFDEYENDHTWENYAEGHKRVYADLGLNV